MTDVFLGQVPSGQGDFEPKAAKLTRKYAVLLDDFDKGEVAACNVSGLPIGFEPHPDFPLATVKKISPERVGNSCAWIVSVEWTTPDNNSGDEDNADPTLDLAEVSIDYEEREEVIRGSLNSTRAYTGGIKNSAGEIFNPPPTEMVPTLVLNIKQNFAPSYTVLTYALSYMDTINDATFLGFPAHSVKMCSVSPKSTVRGDVQYLEITFTLKVKPSWDKELLDIGSYFINGDGEKEEFKTKDGHPRQGLLDGSGHSGTGEKYLPAIQTKCAKNFATLGLLANGYKFV
ncbi:MAG: hypothetical protein U0941_17810 [Planctomycetaceae bacterium]